MNYEVHIVADDALPAGMHQVIVQREEGPPLLVLNGPVAVCWKMMREWEATLEPTWEPSVSRPLRLVSRLGVPADGISGWQAVARHA